jgi:hypothetical protein
MYPLFQIGDTSTSISGKPGILYRASGIVFLFLTWEAMTLSPDSERLDNTRRLRFLLSVDGSSSDSFLAAWDWDIRLTPVQVLARPSLVRPSLTRED